MVLRMVLYAPILALGGVYKVFQTNVSMSWIIALAVILIFCVVLVLFVAAMPKFKTLQKLVDRLNLVTREILTGLSVIRAFSTEKHEEERFDTANKNLTRTNLFVNRAMTFMMPTMILIMNGVSVLIVWNGAHGISDGQMQVGDMMAFIQYTMQIIMAFLMIAMVAVFMPRASVSASRVNEVLETEPSIRNPESAETPDPERRGELEFRSVSFAYPGAEEDVLTDVSFTARTGQITAIVGPSGSGKSTIAKLMAGFWDATGGTVSFGGQDIQNIPFDQLMGEISYVAQDNFLFDRSIRENIRMGDPSATDAEVEAAARAANCHDFIMNLEQGYDTLAGDAGDRLSGGERQRITIARAMLKKASVIILDEATAFADPESEAQIQQAISRLVRGKTPDRGGPPAEHHPERRSDPGDRGRPDRPVRHPRGIDGSRRSVPGFRHGAPAEPGLEPPGQYIIS